MAASKTRLSAGLAVLLLTACGESAPPEPELNFEESLQQQLIQARPGDTIEVPAGTHELSRGLSLSVDGVTIRGGGAEPDSEPLAALAQATGEAVPAVVWDGTIVPGSEANDILCLANNSGESFVNLDAPGGFASPSFDATAHRCSMTALSGVSFADD